MASRGQKIAGGRGAVGLEHGGHLVAQRAEFRDRGADDVRRHNGGRCLPERAGRNLVTVVSNCAVADDYVDFDGGAADATDPAGGRVGMFDPPGNWLVCSDFEDLLGIKIAQFHFGYIAVS